VRLLLQRTTNAVNYAAERERDVADADADDAAGDLVLTE
jgi:hypothetical protein